MGDNNVESDEVQVHTIRVEVKVPKEMFIVSNKENFKLDLPMNSSSNDTSSPCKSKVEGKVMSSRPAEFVCNLLVLKREVYFIRINYDRTYQKKNDKLW